MPAVSASVQNPTPTEKCIGESPDTPPANLSKPQDSTIPQHIHHYLSIVLIGTPSLERFLEIAEHQDKPEWQFLKRRLTARISFIQLNVLLITIMFTIIATIEPSYPGPVTDFLWVCIVVAVLCAALCGASALGLTRFVNTVQPQTVRELRTSAFKRKVVATLLAMPSFLWIMSMYIIFTGVTRASWSDASTFLKVLVITANVEMIVFLPMTLVSFFLS